MEGMAYAYPAIGSARIPWDARTMRPFPHRPLPPSRNPVPYGGSEPVAALNSVLYKGYLYEAAGYFNSSSTSWRLVLDIANNIIWHWGPF